MCLSLTIPYDDTERARFKTAYKLYTLRTSPGPGVCLDTVYRKCRYKNVKKGTVIESNRTNKLLSRREAKMNKVSRGIHVYNRLDEALRAMKSYYATGSVLVKVRAHKSDLVGEGSFNNKHSAVYTQVRFAGIVARKRHLPNGKAEIVIDYSLL